MINDFDFIISVLKEFVKKEHIQENLKVLFESSFINKWEMWLQTELAIHIHSNDHVSKEEVTTEETFEIRENSSIDQDRIRIDLMFRRNEQNRFIGLELKHHKDPHSCINLMFKDWDKVRGTRKKSMKKKEIQQLFLVGIHEHENINLRNKRDKQYLNKYMIDVSKQYKRRNSPPFNQKNFRFMLIPKTNLCCTVFHW